MRNNARISVVFAVALPEPFIVLKVMQKSFTILGLGSFTTKASILRFGYYSKDNLGADLSRRLIKSMCSIRICNAWLKLPCRIASTIL